MMNEEKLKETKEKVVDIFMRELDNRNYSYSSRVIKNIVDLSVAAKMPNIELFSKHPNWNPDKLMIQFDADFTRKIETEAVYAFRNYLRESLGGYYNTTPEQDRILGFIANINTQFFSPSMDVDIEEINNLNENFKLRNNMKSSKAIGKICREMGWDKFENYNQRYANLCDNLNPIKVKRHTVISFNPVDFLLMSNGTSWHSCHDIAFEPYDAGCYSSGTISYMLDEHSFVFYTVDAEFDGEDIEREEKIQRQIFGYNDEVIFQSRLYPQGNDYGAEQVYTDIRNIVQKVVADCLEKPNLWSLTKKEVKNIVSKGYGATCYPDWSGSNPGSELCTLSTLQERTSTLERKIIMGKMPICIECGEEHDITENINCCGYRGTCDGCGCTLRRDEGIYCEGSDGTYCENCVEYCEDCGQYEYRNRGEYVESVDRWVCEWCLDDRYYQCDNCGEYIHKDDIVRTEEGNIYCEDCADDETFVCEECGKRYRIEEDCYDEVTGKDYCTDCYDDLMEQREQEKEEENDEVA